MQKYLTILFTAAVLSACGGSTEQKELVVPEPPVTEGSGSTTDPSDGSDNTNPPTSNQDGDDDGYTLVKKQYIVTESGKLSSYFFNPNLEGLSNVKLLKSPQSFSFDANTGKFDFTTAYFDDAERDVVFTAQKEGVAHKYIIDFISYNSPVIDGYTSLDGKGESSGQRLPGLSVLPTDTLNLHLNADTVVQDKLYITDISGRVVKQLDANYASQKPKNSEPWKNGFGYEVTAQVALTGLKSGVYHVNGEDKIVFIVRNSKQDAKVTLVYPTNTQNAYACHGGKGIYACGKTPKDHVVSFLRPIKITPEYGWSWDIINLINPFLQWTEFESHYGDSVQYITDADLDNYQEFANSKVLMVPAHNEYWTIKAQDNFNQFVDSGNNAFIAGGNIMWWHTRYEDNGRKMVVFKNDPDPDAEKGQQTTYFHRLLDESGQSRGAHHSIGALFSYGGYNENRWDENKENNPMRVIRPNAPIFAGVDLAMCEEIDMSHNHEMDGPVLNGFDVNGFPNIRYDLYRDVHNFEILAYAWGYRGGHTIGTMHAFQRKADSGTVVQFASNGATAFAFTNNSQNKYRKVLHNVFSTLIDGQYKFESDTLYKAELKQEMVFPYRGEKMTGVEACPR